MVISHGLTLAPTQVQVTPGGNAGAGGLWVDTFTSTGFTVHMATTLGAVMPFSWSARVFNY